MSADEMEGPTFKPMTRWDGEPADMTVLTDGFRFPYACSVVTPNRLMKSAMSEKVSFIDSTGSSLISHHRFPH